MIDATPSAARFGHGAARLLGAECAGHAVHQQGTLQFGAFGADEKLFAVIVMSLLLLYRHSGNISNLMAGKESRIGSKSKGAATAKPAVKKK